MLVLLISLEFFIRITERVYPLKCHIKFNRLIDEHLIQVELDLFNPHEVQFLHPSLKCDFKQALQIFCPHNLPDQFRQLPEFGLTRSHIFNGLDLMNDGLKRVCDEMS